ncbi:uncharacterized protein SPSK_01267 [Sporothrix schenckii 1099-18]|uniref:Uncharacterized protein n=1 Tax=Sporothrix schenckii 1099-18 TaxID=1397361 RepID=A0A0F2LWW6_SPOSC|nr:uncharacterized protein SPSK_01267 [Sporothrix schenckii 1099-18]KJR81349.1 hypothetical protein SPSK_01267 [Sporothrix schenckii 1099-18]
MQFEISGHGKRDMAMKAEGRDDRERDREREGEDDEGMVGRQRWNGWEMDGTTTWTRALETKKTADESRRDDETTPSNKPVMQRDAQRVEKGSVSSAATDTLKPLMPSRAGDQDLHAFLTCESAEMRDTIGDRGLSGRWRDGGAQQGRVRQKEREREQLEECIVETTQVEKARAA